MSIARSAGLLLGVVLAFACSGDTPVQPVSPKPSDTNRPPTAVLMVSWTGQEGGSTGFTAAGSRDPDGDSLYYSWDWGDGTTITGTYPEQMHDYLDNGSYTVVLTVTDTHGAKASATAQVSISNATPYIWSIELATPPLPAPVPMTATIRAMYSDQGPADNPVLSIDWGDGTVSTDTTHVYRAPGAYSLRFTVTDKDGASSSQWLSRIVWVYDASQSGSVPGYEIIDLGTLGGEFTRPSALNNRGEVVGTSATADGKTHAFLWRDGVLTDISPSGEDIGEARRINDAGWVVGVGGVDFPGRLPRWKDGVFTGFLSVPASEYGAWPVKILESGDVLLNVEKHEYPSPVFVRNGTAINLGGLASIGDHGWAADMNAHDQIVGSSAYQASGAGSLDFRAFLWENGLITELRNLGTAPCNYPPERECGYSEARDINESGQIVGSAFNGSILRAVLWDAATRTPLDLGFGNRPSRAVAINERGEIAGDALGEGGEGFFRDTHGNVVSIGSLSVGKTLVAAMNEDGVVVGTSKTATGEDRAFVWRRDGGIRDLGTSSFGGPGVGTGAIAINDRGDVLGYAAPCELFEGSYRCFAWNQSRAILWRRSESPVARRSTSEAAGEIVVFRQSYPPGGQARAPAPTRSWRDRITPAGVRLP